ncbi:hypothetical protein PENTCL1PPCAC_12998, partial [Pristionchus entomophagus]
QTSKTTKERVDSVAFQTETIHLVNKLAIFDHYDNSPSPPEGSYVVYVWVSSRKSDLFELRLRHFLNMSNVDLSKKIIREHQHDWSKLIYFYTLVLDVNDEETFSSFKTVMGAAKNTLSNRGHIREVEIRYY